MNGIKILVLFFTLLLFGSCDFISDKEMKKLNEKKISNNKIEINWFRTSSITTVHEHVEVTKSGKTKKIAELNEGGIQQIAFILIQ